MVNPPWRESTRENGKRGNGIVRGAVRGNAGGYERDVEDMQSSAHWSRRVPFSPARRARRPPDSRRDGGATLSGETNHAVKLARDYGGDSFARMTVP
jgi:hypothetical protein